MVSGVTFLLPFVVLEVKKVWFVEVSVLDDFYGQTRCKSILGYECPGDYRDKKGSHVLRTERC